MKERNKGWGAETSKSSSPAETARVVATRKLSVSLEYLQRAVKRVLLSECREALRSSKESSQKSRKEISKESSKESSKAASLRVRQTRHPQTSRSTQMCVCVCVCVCVCKCVCVCVCVWR
jgi:hypothetical protein